MALPHYPYISVDDYLILDRNSREARYEYLDGELSMLAGGSNDHSLIAANLIGILQQALEDSPCRVYTSDVRLRLSETRYVHPDTVVSCDQDDIEEEDTISHPSFVTEVLSPTTETFDRRKKAICYRECESIQEYLLIDSQRIHVELHRRDRSIWYTHTYKSGDTINLSCFDLQFPIAKLYKKTRLINQLNKKFQ
jgi:Uma2 family endonuclease